MGSDSLRKLERTLAMAGARPAQLPLVILLPALVAVLDAIGICLLLPISWGLVAGQFRIPHFASLDRLALLSPSATLIALLSAFLISVICKNAISYGQAVHAARRRARYTRNAYDAVFSSFLRRSKQLFDRTNKGHLLQVLSSCERLIEFLRIVEVAIGRSLRGSAAVRRIPSIRP